MPFTNQSNARKQDAPNRDRKGAPPQPLKYWARHGSTKYIWDYMQLENALDYVINRQGVPMDYLQFPPTDLNTIAPFPIAYLITFTTYGSWLHGDQRTTVDPEHNTFTSLRIQSFPALKNHRENLLSHPPFKLDEPTRKIVLNAIIEVCRYRNWILHAIHIRTEHVHIVVSAPAPPEKVMNDFKAYSSRAINRSHPSSSHPSSEQRP